MDKRKNNGGKRAGAGRKPKAEELKLIETIDAIIDPDSWQKIFEKIAEKAKQGSFQHAELILEYRFGKPKETVEYISIEKPESLVFKKSGN